MTHPKTGALLQRLSAFEKSALNHNQLCFNGTFHFVKDAIKAAVQSFALGMILGHLLPEVHHDQ
ncbi:hypothetical protein [Vibrio fortis]|uniref:hypothetical protein n=1 Tax=Vibrio fortis TaxID=212667 RepID=UPI003EBBCBA9